MDITENKCPGVSTATYVIDLALNDAGAHEEFAALARTLDIGVLGMSPPYIHLYLQQANFEQ